MSLILRQKCQPILNAAGLQKLHVGLSSNYMTLHGECGQQLLVVKGIQFASKNPKVGEMNYAEELFTTFIEKHSKAILDFIKISEKAKKVIDKNPVLDPKKYSTYSTYVQVRDSRRSNIMSIQPDGKISINKQCSGVEEIVEMCNEHTPVVMEYFAATGETRELNQQVQEARNALAKCDI